MIDFKRFISLFVAIAVLLSASTKAMFGPGHGGDDYDNVSENELVTGLNSFTLDEAAKPFFTTMQLRGYFTLRLINDTLSQLTISINLEGENQLLSTTNLVSGRFHDVFIPQNTSYILTATRDKVPHARPMVLRINSNQDIGTHISRWRLARPLSNGDTLPLNRVNLFNVAPDPHSMLED